MCIRDRRRPNSAVVCSGICFCIASKRASVLSSCGLLDAKISAFCRFPVSSLLVFVLFCHLFTFLPFVGVFSLFFFASCLHRSSVWNSSAWNFSIIWLAFMIYQLITNYSRLVQSVHCFYCQRFCSTSDPLLRRPTDRRMVQWKTKYKTPMRSLKISFNYRK